MDINDVKKYMKKIIETVDYLHHLNPPVIHRDLKSANILMQND